VKLNPLCPKRAAKESVLTFESSYHPLLAIEARIPRDPLNGNPRADHQSYSSRVAPASYAEDGARPSILMYSIDLLSEDLFGPHFNRVITLDYSKLPAVFGTGNFPKGWGKVLITVYACDDTNRDGKCSDEIMKEQITVRSPTFQACHFPSAVPVDVYSCK